MTEKRKTLAVDFDGVLNSYTSDFTPGSIPDPPVPGAIVWLIQMTNHFDVAIFSVRADNIAGATAIWQWLAKHGVPLNLPITVTDKKPRATMYVDDRAWVFTGANYPSPEEVKAFKPWNRK